MNSQVNMVPMSGQDLGEIVETFVTKFSAPWLSNDINRYFFIDSFAYRKHFNINRLF